ncbi:30S ribosomal protein S6 [Coxiella endosymbiont of Rhipicephalus microplus]|uniref:30S ribosomal protein S6 n=1 Tax=Coxiella endosymbiont of Rhipicephalus microplus TaxID=1656186 RepID=UPI000C803874|nr:30S ribosomal protein S6 [Coxiella endosymbiont of Rhipicephalus microplus]
MRHYEIVILVHIDQSTQVPAMVERYQAMIKDKGGKVHRLEDWGRQQLAYSINKVYKAHYILMNIECDQAVLDQLKNAFRYNDAVMRNLILKRNYAITEPSPIMQSIEKGKLQKEKLKFVVEETPKISEEV